MYVVQSWWVVRSCEFRPRPVWNVLRRRWDAPAPARRTYRCVDWAAASAPSSSPHLPALQVPQATTSLPGVARRPATAGFISCRTSRCPHAPVCSTGYLQLALFDVETLVKFGCGWPLRHCSTNLHKFFELLWFLKHLFSDLLLLPISQQGFWRQLTAHNSRR